MFGNRPYKSEMDADQQTRYDNLPEERASTSMSMRGSRAASPF
jgi:hypothetical protein